MRRPREPIGPGKATRPPPAADAGSGDPRPDPPAGPGRRTARRARLDGAAAEPLPEADVLELPPQPQGLYLLAARPAEYGKQGNRIIETRPCPLVRRTGHQRLPAGGSPAAPCWMTPPCSWKYSTRPPSMQPPWSRAAGAPPSSGTASWPPTCWMPRRPSTTLPLWPRPTRPSPPLPARHGPTPASWPTCSPK